MEVHWISANFMECVEGGWQSSLNSEEIVTKVSLMNSSVFHPTNSSPLYSHPHTWAEPKFRKEKCPLGFTFSSTSHYIHDLL
jgi:hypothetical protein